MEAPTQQQQYESNIVQILSMQRNQAQDALVDAQARLAVAGEEIKRLTARVTELEAAQKNADDKKPAAKKAAR